MPRQKEENERSEVKGTQNHPHAVLAGSLLRLAKTGDFAGLRHIEYAGRPTEWSGQANRPRFLTLGVRPDLSPLFLRCGVPVRPAVA